MFTSSNMGNLLIWKPNILTGKLMGSDPKFSNDSQMLNESYQIQKDDKLKNKCRRSNTTYTLLGSKSNNKVIDYFNKLEMSKPVKKMANIRKLTKVTMPVDAMSNIGSLPQVNEACDDLKFKKDDAQMSETIESLSKIAGNLSHGNEVEKIQDVLFHDESSMGTTNDANSSLSSSLGNNRQSLSFLESVGSPNKLPLLSLKNQSSPQTKEVEVAATANAEIKLNETHSVDTSMEKLRRTVSMPGIENVFSCFLVYFCRLSLRLSYFFKEFYSQLSL